MTDDYDHYDWLEEAFYELKQKGGDINAPVRRYLDYEYGYDEKPLLFWAMSERSRDCKRWVGRLLDEGADIEQKDKYGQTAIDYADTPEKIDFLVSKGADIEGQTLLHQWAAETHIDGTHPMLAHLVEHHALDINMQDQNGNTPLYHAVTNSNNLEYLLEKGADPFIVNHKGITPMDIFTDLGFADDVREVMADRLKRQIREALDSQSPTDIEKAREEAVQKISGTPITSNEAQERQRTRSRARAM